MTKEELRHWLYDYTDAERANAAHAASDGQTPPEGQKEPIAFEENAAPSADAVSAAGESPDRTVYPARNPRLDTHDFHAHAYAELIYLYDGVCNVLIEGGMLHLQKGDFCIISPNVYHLIARNEAIVLCFQVRRETFIDLCTEARFGDNEISRFASDFSGRKSLAKYLLAQNADHPHIRALAEQLIMAYYNGGAFRQLYTETYLQQMLAFLIERRPLFSVEKGEFCSRELLMIDILRYIRQNYRTVALSEVAAQFRYTPTHICRLLRRYAGTSFSKIVTELRLEAAVELLERTELSVQEIAVRTGYESIEHFHRTFKAAYAQTPLQYRQNTRESQIPRFAGR